MQDEYLSIQDIAKQLSVSEKTVRRWVKSGELPSVELGGRFRISRHDLQKFLEQHRSKHAQDKDQ